MKSKQTEPEVKIHSLLKMYILKIGGITLPVTKDVIKIGRHTSNDIVLGETRVSRFHSEIITINGRIFLKDIKTVNGTFLGDKRILPERELLLKPDDSVGIGCPAGELQACTIRIECSSDESPPNEDNEVVSTTNDSDSNENFTNGSEDDERHEADPSYEESMKPLQMQKTKCPYPPKRNDKEIEKRLPPTSTVNEPADRDQSSSRQSDTASLPQVKSEPLCSPDKSKSVPSLPSSRTADSHVKQPPADDIDESVSQEADVASNPQQPPVPPCMKTALNALFHEFWQEKVCGSSILPSLLNISNASATSPSANSSGRTSDASTSVKAEPSVKVTSHPAPLAASARKKKRVESKSKRSKVVPDVPATDAVAVAKTECIKVDLCEEPENDVMEVLDEPSDEAAGTVSRCASALNESTRNEPPAPEPVLKSSREDQTDRPSSSKPIINLCDANEGADDVIEISDEESGNKPRRLRQNRKYIDPNPIVIEDTRDDEESSDNLQSCSDKPVVTSAPAEPGPSNRPNVSQQITAANDQKAGLPQPILTTRSEPQVKLHQTNVISLVEHSSSNKPEVELQQPVNPSAVEDPPCNKQVRFAQAIATTAVEPPPSIRRNVAFQMPIITIEDSVIDEQSSRLPDVKIEPSDELTVIENSYIHERIFRLPELKVEPSNGLRAGLQDPIPATPADPSRTTDTSEAVIFTKSLLPNAASTSSFIDLCEDQRLPAIVKCEPVAYSNYSLLDEIIALDSDDEDFPLSQLNTSQINDVPDFSDSFERMFEDSEYVKEEPQMLLCNENTWFEPFSQTEMVEGKHVARIQLSTSDEAMTDQELQSILDEEPDGAVESELDGAGDKMEVDEEPSSKSSSDVRDVDDLQQSEWRSVLKKKYPLKSCNVLLTDARPIINRQSRKAQREADEQRRRSSLSLGEPLLELYDEPVTDASTKKRSAHRSPQRARKRKRKNRSPAMSVQEKRLIKEKRKEKLKEITPKSNETEVNRKDVVRPEAKPVVKVTDKNRGSILMDTMFKERSLPKRPAKMETKDVSSKREKSSKSEPSTSKQRAHPKEAQSVPKQKAGDSSNFKSNDANLANQIFDRYCKDNEKPGPSRRGSICEPEEHAFASALNRVTNEVAKKPAARKNDVGSTKKSSNSVAQRRDSCTSKKYQSDASVPGKPKKSCLKKAPLVYGPTNIYDPPKPKKAVRFRREQDCQIIPWDALERRNNGIFAPAYKLNENLIREGISEFEMAMAKVCSWNVKWLEEQQKYHEPPPLYPESGQLVVSSTLTVKYKEELKVMMFNNLWQAIFRSWNKPDNDFLPHTQYINEKTSLSTLKIESIDTTKDQKMWYIFASRTVPANDTENDLSHGQVVILNFPIVTQAVGAAPRKTMVFGYLAAFSKTLTADNESIHQRMIFRISAKPFEVVLGEAKLKVLSYLKSSLRPFQALAMITRSPLTDLIIDPTKKFYFEPSFDASGDWFHDKFLDPSQRRAVANCLNCILSPEPSLCLIDGAPGTGKSQVIVSLMRELFLKNNRNRFPNDLRVLIITAQDVVADDLSFRLEGLNKKEKCFNFLRYGNCRGMHLSMKNCTLDKKIRDLLNEDQGTELINLDEEKNNLKAKIHSIKLVLDSKSAKEEKINEAKAKLINNEREWNDMERENSKVIEQLKSQVAREISIESADIVITSAYSCWTSSFEQDFVPTHYNKGDIHKFTVCIFDDASLINETAMLVPMMLMVRSLILVGDHRNQIIINKSRSPFYRLLNDCTKKAPSAVTTLNCQYRLPPHITHWVDEFYDIKCKPRSVPSGGSKVKIKSLFVFDVLIDAAEDINYRYEIQANYCSLLVEKLNKLVDDPSIRFGVIVAQSSQKDIIKGASGLFERGRKMIVETLDEFSGREQEVVILCLPYHCVQYASWLYVAVTRARSSLFVCGDFAQLKDHESVCSLLRFAKSRNLYSQRDPYESDVPNGLILSSS